MRLKLFLISLLLFSCLAPYPLRAQSSADDIQAKIDARSAEIEALEKVIKDYQRELQELGNRGTTLAKTVAELNLTQKKLQASIALTQDKITAKNLEIQSLSKRIRGAEDTIETNKLYVMELMQTINEEGGRTIPQIVLSGRSLSEAWNTIDRLAILESDIEDHIQGIKRTRNQLTTSRLSTERAKAELVRLQNQLNDERKVVIETANQQKKLLSQTKNSEAAYQKLLTEKLALKEAFEREILEFESQLQFALDSSKLPKIGSSVLSWPLDNIRITQYFGNTPFASANPQVYSGRGHNGIDFGASIGTPVRAALSGVVSGTGNTDVIAGCYSLGKWILLKHGNGLSTLYAHLSVHSVAPGAQVSTGQIIGYSGNTGYTTGPHLHFGVYASSGIQIQQFTSSRNCRGAILPVAALAAYLNPLSYLPAR